MILYLFTELLDFLKILLLRVFMVSFCDIVCIINKGTGTILVLKSTYCQVRTEVVMDKNLDTIIEKIFFFPISQMLYFPISQMLYLIFKKLLQNICLLK